MGTYNEEYVRAVFKAWAESISFPGLPYFITEVVVRGTSAVVMVNIPFMEEFSFQIEGTTVGGEEFLLKWKPEPVADSFSATGHKVPNGGEK